MILPKVEAQNKQPKNMGASAGAVAAVAGAAAGAAILSGVFAHYGIKEYKELLEASATEYYLRMGNEGMFNVTLLLEDGTSMKDLSKTSVTVFEVTERSYDAQTRKEKNKTKKIMTVFRTNNAWINQYGIIWNNVEVKVWNSDDWGKFYLAYLSLSTPIKESSQGKISHKAVPYLIGIDSSRFFSANRSDGIGEEHDFITDTIQNNIQIYEKAYDKDPGNKNYFRVALGEPGNSKWKVIRENSYKEDDKDYRKRKSPDPNYRDEYRYERRMYKYYRISKEVKYYVRRYKSIYDLSLRIPNSYDIDDDSYIVADYDDNFKVGFNENRMIIYLKQSDELVELRNKLIKRIVAYFRTDN